MALQVELVSPEAVLYSGEADMVVCRTLGGGEIAFLTGHAPFLGALGIAAVRVILTGGGEIAAAVHGGFVEVKDNRVTILSDVAELAEVIDVERARRAQSEADAQVRANADDAVAIAALARAETRITVASR